MIASTRPEVGLPLHALEHVHGDEAALAPGRRAEHRVVGRDGSHLDRERHLEAARGISSHHRGTASGVRSRGSAYSISVKRTSRGLAKIDAERSTRTELPATGA